MRAGESMAFFGGSKPLTILAFTHSCGHPGMMEFPGPMSDGEAEKQFKQMRASLCPDCAP